MKLRLRGQSLRFRLNQKEVAALARGEALREQVLFSGNATFSYELSPAASPEVSVRFDGGRIEVAVPSYRFRAWNESDEIGLRYEVEGVSVSIEKDLECTEPNMEEHDPYAYPRKAAC